jgi:hypothetical protein
MILEEHFKEKPPYDTVFITIQLFFKLAVERFEVVLLPVLITVFKHYSKRLGELRETPEVVRKVMDELANSIRLNRPLAMLVSYFEVLSHFLDATHFSSSFPELINLFLQIVDSIPNKASVEGDELLCVLTKGLRVLGTLPAQVEPLLMLFKWQFEGVELVNAFTELLRHSRSEDFLNWLCVRLTAKEFTLASCLLLNSLVYYQMARLNPNSIGPLIEKIYVYRMRNRANSNLLNGKVNLLFLLMLREDRQLVHSFLLQTDWQPLQQQLRQELLSLSLDRGEDQANRHFSDEVYRFLYISEHVYCCRYDIEVFLMIQLGMLLNSL